MTEEIDRLVAAGIPVVTCDSDVRQSRRLYHIGQDMVKSDVYKRQVLRAKGIVPAADGGEWLHFDYVPGAPEIRRGSADYTGRLCVIGSELDEERIAALFGVA